MKKYPSQAQLKKLLDYDADTGLFIWRVSSGNGTNAGDIAGTVEKTGYRRVRIEGKSYRAQRLAFLYMTGSIPRFVDHKNGVKDDNRWFNLRSASHKQNSRNRRIHKNNQTGLKGVSRNTDGSFRSRIRVDGVLIYVGRFSTAEEAHAAYCEAGRKFFMEFFNAGENRT